MANDSEGRGEYADEDKYIKRLENGHQISPCNQVKFPKTWPSPTTRDYKGMRGAAAQERKGNPIDTLPIAIAEISGGALNPDWVEWLMGWPVGWSNVEPLGELDWRDWSVDPADIGEVPRVTSAKENRANRLKAIGNGQVPQCVVMAWEHLA